MLCLFPAALRSEAWTNRVPSARPQTQLTESQKVPQDLFESIASSRSNQSRPISAKLALTGPIANRGRILIGVEEIYLCIEAKGKRSTILHLATEVPFLHSRKLAAI
ncbi:hypothetical protein JD844_002117 [Phrynosoma platyrhinos]|uniref:Uncharacterized protein n=1 Tax=Phrynosoma platyrhinos TaxID=52577 RepID=A0ABQ7TAV0_PHRPL|nr:hypothetical protein JD844_002117 [Phrynosoma platyrhinos]